MIWPDKLVKDIARRRAVLFFGAGVSMNSVNRNGGHPKSWMEFLKAAAEKLENPDQSIVRKLIKANDFLTACEVIRRGLGKTDFNDLVRAEFQTPAYKPAKIHELIWRLDLGITMTPNFDNIYDTYAASASDGTLAVKNYFDTDIAELLRSGERVLLKCHGSVTYLNKLIFTRTDYANARSSHRDFYELVDSLLRTHTFLFIGCGLDDPDIRILLENYRYRYQDAQEHFFVLPAKRLSTNVKAVYEDSLKLKILEYRYTQTLGHTDLVNELEMLIQKVEIERRELATTQNW